MAGTQAGGKKAAATNKARYGKTFYNKIGAAGGASSNEGGFRSRKIGRDGLTGPERAKLAGSKGGKLSKRPKNEQE